MSLLKKLFGNRWVQGTGVALLCLALGGVLFGWWVFHRVEGAYFDSNGVAIHYTVEGEGPPLILVHGMAVNADLNWRRSGLLGRLAKDFEVIAFDCRGHGLSGKPTRPEAYGQEMIDDIIRLMDHLDIESAHLAGYSMGGFIALAAGMQYPERIRSLTLSACGWRKPEEMDKVLPPYRSPPQAEVIRAQHLAGSGFDISGLLRHYGSKLNKRLNGRSLQAFQAIRKSYDSVALTEAQLKANTTPMCCIIGEGDGLLPYASNLREARPDIDFILIPGVNHFSLILNRQYKEAMYGFLKQQLTRPAPRRAAPPEGAAAP